ncbi:hypothetical protein Taro_053983 [Colocasia esculenta]|uniref:Uncharacterized protein n=1 Tax=Colocasia esculenta TaxID=4460 RepID=A0A843XP54_COLES|nr:hypothetical protein [Colocasia esculenta]
MKDYDAILGLDWLEEHYALVDCRGPPRITISTIPLHPDGAPPDSSPDPSDHGGALPDRRPDYRIKEGRLPFHAYRSEAGEGNQTRKCPLPRPAVLVEEERTYIIPRAISPLQKAQDSSYLIRRKQAATALAIKLSALLYVIPLEHTKDVVALRNLGFEFPFTKNNDYPRGSLAA